MPPPCSLVPDATSLFVTSQRLGSLSAWIRSLRSQRRHGAGSSGRSPARRPRRRPAGPRSRGGERPHPGADRLRQDARRVPARDRPARTRARDGPAAALRLAAEGAQLRRRAEPPRAARRARVRRSASASAPATRRRRSGGELRQDAARHPDHDARVALPAADLAGARDAARGRDGDRRRGARRRRHEARRAPRALARAARRARSSSRSQRIGLSATQRPLEEIGRFVSGDRPIQLVDAGHAQGARPRGRRPGRGHARAGHARTSSPSRS